MKKNKCSFCKNFLHDSLVMSCFVCVDAAWYFVWHWGKTYWPPLPESCVDLDQLPKFRWFHRIWYTSWNLNRLDFLTYMTAIVVRRSNYNQTYSRPHINKHMSWAFICTGQHPLATTLACRPYQCPGSFIYGSGWCGVGGPTSSGGWAHPSSADDPADGGGDSDRHASLMQWARQRDITQASGSSPGRSADCRIVSTRCIVFVCESLWRVLAFSMSVGARHQAYLGICQGVSPVGVLYPQHEGVLRVPSRRNLLTGEDWRSGGAGEVRSSFFQVVSFQASHSFRSFDVAHWPSYLDMSLLLM